ncbi:hypothetical protein VSDG_09266 [Cytospora chrysosperma]|uniref:Uncharacterized protein n=1 Tax=Cytospora chrysosperma TaxID=252740 RepID=A0A423VB72_CYTCH|nr:hypothetical protein VSDG_09266 [Valsa sordida]
MRTTESKHGARVKWASPTTHGLRSSASSRDERKCTTYARRSATRGRERRRPRADKQQQGPTRRKSARTVTSTPVDRDTSDAHSGDASPSDMSNFAGNQDISKMNGLLDVWDARGNPGWEEETFALCDLSRCPGCGKFYVPMRTLRHVCRA